MFLCWRRGLGLGKVVVEVSMYLSYGLKGPVVFDATFRSQVKILKQNNLWVKVSVSDTLPELTLREMWELWLEELKLSWLRHTISCLPLVGHIQLGGNQGQTQGTPEGLHSPSCS